MTAISNVQEQSPETGTGHKGQMPPKPNQLLSRDEVEDEYGLTRRWLELAALSGNGPPFVKVSNRMVRYTRSVLEKWITDRTRSSTSDTGHQPKN
jgi:predicted DNA-binding transcriptional regulator AlpA